jgi:hypothetical protein
MANREDTPAHPQEPIKPSGNAGEVAAKDGGLAQYAKKMAEYMKKMVRKK